MPALRSNRPDVRSLSFSLLFHTSNNHCSHFSCTQPSHCYPNLHDSSHRDNNEQAKEGQRSWRGIGEAMRCSQEEAVKAGFSPGLPVWPFRTGLNTLGCTDCAATHAGEKRKYSLSNVSITFNRTAHCYYGKTQALVVLLDPPESIIPNIWWENGKVSLKNNETTKYLHFLSV